MKTYKDFEKRYIGTSDVSSLILAGYKTDEGFYLQELHFGGDNSYSAYVVDEPIQIPEHYQKVGTFNSWLKIYDDEGLICRFCAKQINVYRAREMGCIIELINKDNKKEEKGGF